MKEILERCAQLARLDHQDAYKLEADILDMISMADGLAGFEFACDEYGDAKALETFRIDSTDEFGALNITENAPVSCDGCPCVPRVRGV